MKVRAGRAEPDSVVLIFEKRNERITEFGPRGLRDDLRRRRPNRPVAITESPVQQSQRFLVLRSRQEKQHLRAIGEFRIFQEFTDRGVAVSGTWYRNIANPLTHQKQQ